MSLKRNSNQQNLKQAIDRLLEAYGLKDKMLQLDIITSWEQLMGKAIARRTREMYFKDRILYISLDSSVLREELMMGKSKIIQLLNEKTGKELISDIVFK